MTSFGSVCSGIEAASVAWHPLGWKAAWLAEIEPFPCAVLAHHYPDVPNLGDMTTIASRVLTSEVGAPDVLAGGTPCQAFSVAGLRESMADERGNLTLKYVELLDAIDHVRLSAGKPAAVAVWENVPGVLSTSDNAFGCFLGALAGTDSPIVPLSTTGWTDAGVVAGPRRSVAWRILDAQFFGLAQRRRRVFVVASARVGFDPAAVLFEWEGLRRDSAPSREAGKAAPIIPSRSTAGGGMGTDFDCDGGLIANALQAADGMHAVRRDADNLIPEAFGGGNTAGAIDLGTCLTHHGGRMDFDSETFIAHSLRDEVGHALRASSGGGDKAHVLAAMQVRRLTPRECERLQGFADDYTLIPITKRQPVNGQPAVVKFAADGPRYKALGNSWAVPVARWVGQRVAQHLEGTL